MPLSANQIYHGDCTHLLNQLEPGTVDLVFADPPFNIGYQYDVYDDRRQAGEYLDWCRNWIDGVDRCLKPDGTFWLAIGDEYAAELKIIAQQAGFTCRSWVIWYYTFGVNCARGFSRSHTHLFHFVKDPNEFTFNKDNPQVRVKSARQLVYADRRANPKGRLPDNTWIIRPQDAPDSFRPDHDTWYFARVAGTFKEREGFHGCQMPEQLLGRIIRVSSNPQELVLDPFAGSGTTLSVAKKLGRRWIGLELSQEYVDFVNQRLAAAQVGDPLDGPENPLNSAPSTAKGKRRKKATADREMEQGIVAAYHQAADGHSADYLLCHPELNRQFLVACRELGVPGSESLWNQCVLRLRKSGKFPPATNKPKRLNQKQMDSFSFASEIAIKLLSVEYGLTLDAILCTPEFAGEFDQLAARFAPGYTPFQYRWAALAIRKRAGLKNTRRLASETFGHWLRERLPQSIALRKFDASQFQQPGVYLLCNQEQKLYVGETEDIGVRVVQAIENSAWQQYKPSHVYVWPAHSAEKHALQSVLVERFQPVLNSTILRLGVESATKRSAGRPSAVV